MNTVSKQKNIKSVNYLLKKIRKSNELVDRNTFERLDTSDLTYKLEWNKGVLEQEDYMKRNERILIDNITTKFVLEFSLAKGNRIMGEADVFLAKTNTIRRPDVAYFTRDEIVNATNHETAPQLLIEVASESNSGFKIQKKIKEYFANGALKVWYIYPEQQLVYVYSSIKEVKICMEDEMCEALLSGKIFTITVNEIFKDFIYLS